MKTVIAGSRTVSKDDVEDAMQECPFTRDITTVVSGTARGADTYGEEWAGVWGVNIVRFPADWNRFGRKAAGMIRNKEMAEFSDALIAVWDGKSPGTKNMIANAKHLDLIVWVWDVSQGAGYYECP